MIPDKIPRQEYTDLNGKVLFPFSFDVVTSDSVKVEITESGQESGTIVDPTSYTVEIPSSGSAPAAGNVRFNEPLSIQGGTMTIFRQTEFSQESELGNGSQFYPKVVESALDKLTMIAQELKGGVVTTRQGERYGYADSAGVAEGLKEGAVVDSAEHAHIAEYASSFAAGASIENAEHAARATLAESATTANMAGGLTPLAKADIIASAGEGGSVLLGAKAYAVMPDMHGGQQIFNASSDKSSSYSTSSGAVNALGNGYGGVLILHGELNDGYDSDDGFKMTDLTGYGGTINVVDPKSCGEGGGGGGVTGIGATVSDGSATVTLSGGTGAVTFIGAGNTSVIGSDGGIVISGGGGGEYTGPFAANATSTTEQGDCTVKVMGGVVVVGPSRYPVPLSSGVVVSDGYDLYLVGTSSGGSQPTFVYEARDYSTTISSGSFCTKIAENLGGVMRQVQYGEITDTMWGQTGGGGGTFEARSVGTSYTETTTGLLNVVVEMHSAAGAGEALIITSDTTPFSAIVSPQSGVQDRIQSSFTKLIPAGTTWSASNGITGATVAMTYITF